MKNIKVLSMISCVAILLLTVAIITLNSTFSLPESENFKVVLNTDEERVFIDGTRVDFFHTLGINEKYSFTIDVINKGNIDAEVFKAIKSNLSDYVVGTSAKTNNTYKLSDYITFNVYYESDNETNGIHKDDRLNTYDYLRKGTTNKIKVDLEMKKDDVTQDEMRVLRDTFKRESIDFSLYLQLVFTEL